MVPFSVLRAESFIESMHPFRVVPSFQTVPSIVTPLVHSCEQNRNSREQAGSSEALPRFDRPETEA